MSIYYPKDGNPTEGSVVQTRNLTLKFNSQNESQLARIVTHKPKDGEPPEGSVLQTWNFALKLNQAHKTKAG